MGALSVCAVLFAVGAPSLLWAKGVSGYLPVKTNAILEQDIERLVVLANLPSLTKPYSLAAINQGLARIQKTHPVLHKRLALKLAYYNKRVAVTHASATLSAANVEGSAPNKSGQTLQSKQAIAKPNGRGASTQENAALSIRSHAKVTDWLMLSAGAEVSDEQQQATGSLVSLGFSWAQLDVGFKEYWLSPFNGSAQLLSTQAQTLPSVSLSNHLPITFLGMGFNYDVSLAQLSRQPVLYQGQYSDTKKPLVASVHFAWQPVPWWSLGATRNFQFGGGERPTSFKTILRAFIDPRGADNDASVDEESGNQIASIVSRMHFDGAMPFSLSVELAGEDTANNKDYQLGNPALTAGLFFPLFFSDNVAFTYEYSDWDNAWYVNNVYAEGYSNKGAVLGHWAMQDQHLAGTATPGSSHFIHSQWYTPWRHIVDVSLRTSEHDGTYALGLSRVKYQQAWNMALDYNVPKAALTYAAGALLGKDAFGQNYAQFKVSVLWN